MRWTWVRLRLPLRSAFADAQIGVVDYVSAPEQTAVDRALELAKDISANGKYVSAVNSALG